MREFFVNLIETVDKIKSDKYLSVKYDLVKYSIYFEIGLFSKRLETVKANTPERVDLIESFTDSINVLENVLKTILFICDENNAMELVKQENEELKSVIKQKETEIKELIKASDVFGIEDYKVQIKKLEERVIELQKSNEELIKLI